MDRTVEFVMAAFGAGFMLGASMFALIDMAKKTNATYQASDGTLIASRIWASKCTEVKDGLSKGLEVTTRAPWGAEMTVVKASCGNEPLYP